MVAVDPRTSPARILLAIIHRTSRSCWATVREDGATVGQSDTAVGQGGGVYLTRRAADRAKYETMFTPVAKSLGDYSWSVSYELTAAATNVLQESVNTAQTAVLGAMTDPEAKTATFAAKPGFYYAIEYGSDLNLGANTKGTMATGPSVELDKPTDLPATRGFFRVKVSPSKIDPRQ